MTPDNDQQLHHLSELLRNQQMTSATFQERLNKVQEEILTVMLDRRILQQQVEMLNRQIEMLNQIVEQSRSAAEEQQPQPEPPKRPTLVKKD